MGHGGVFPLRSRNIVNIRHAAPVLALVTSLAPLPPTLSGFPSAVSYGGPTTTVSPGFIAARSASTCIAARRASTALRPALTRRTI